jgi:hypothetical protein
MAGWGMGGPSRFTDFKPLVVSGVISAGIGWVAGLSSADDVGRPYLIAVAAAQYAMYPVWVGLSLTLGFPDAATQSLLGPKIPGLFTSNFDVAPSGAHDRNQES